jgi:hypothetical protein
LPPSAAEYSSERHVIFTISRSEIVKMTCLSKHHSARSAVKNLFTQPLEISLFMARPGKQYFGVRSFLRASARKNERTPNKILRGEAADTTGK